MYSTDGFHTKRPHRWKVLFLSSFRIRWSPQCACVWVALALRFRIHMDVVCPTPPRRISIRAETENMRISGTHTGSYFHPQKHNLAESAQSVCMWVTRAAGFCRRIDVVCPTPPRRCLIRAGAERRSVECVLVPTPMGEKRGIHAVFHATRAESLTRCRGDAATMPLPSL